MLFLTGTSVLRYRQADTGDVPDFTKMVAKNRLWRIVIDSEIQRKERGTLGV